MNIGPEKPGTPLPCKKEFIRGFLAAEGDEDPDAQKRLAKEMGFGYRSGVGEAIFAMVTARPDVAHAITRLSQHNVCPHKIHFAGLRHLLRYLFHTREDGIYYWRAQPREDLPAVPPPQINSNLHDLMMDGRPTHHPLDMYSYMDAEWATCPLTRRSMGGGTIMIAGGAVGWKANLLPTVAMSSTEAEFMEAAIIGRMMLFCRSIMWDLGIPQCAATVGYEDNDACTSMAMAEKPTPRTRHIDVKYHVICQWTEQDLIRLERVASALNVADIFTKQLGPLLFRRHCDYLMGRVPPQYSAHYQNVGMTSNPTRLQRDSECVEAHERWMPGPDTRAAAAAKLTIDPSSAFEEYAIIWDMVTRYWRRSYDGIAA
jgi:hypothetical protein